ncbi:ABC transporter permease [Caminicella sporogenes]|uniref:ABC transporter permease n=1 Tax=Caminicella sporogenes TaxID=166485 RepID=UPI0025404816|nr:ABC transporter permease [Caminicella sporogenes]WIF94037.1 ABC transporter permease [Caminicella sporogenes]
MKKLESIGNRLAPIVFIVILISIWQIAVASGYIKPYILPLPKNVIITFFNILPEIKEHIIITIQEAVYGLGIAVIFAIILAVVMDSVKIIKDAVYPILILSQTVPIIVLAPLFAMWFGFGMFPKVIVVALVCFFPIVVSLLEGLESVDDDLINLIKSMGASKLKIFKIVKFPASMVSFFSGLKVAATYSIMGAVIGEWMGGKAGLGLYLLRAKKSFLIDKVFAVIFLIVLLSITIFKLVSVLQYLFMPWSKENR